IPVFRSLRSVNGHTFATAPAAAEGTEPHQLARLRAPRRLPSAWPWLIRGGALVSLMVLVALFLFMYPQTTITVVPDTQDLSEDLLISASTRVRALSFGQMQVPGRHLEARLDDQEEAVATGKKTRGDKTAVGQVTLTNNTAQ